MDIEITQWALDAYLELKAKNIFSSKEYVSLIRPDSLLLQQYPNHPKFNSGKFWSIATLNHQKIDHGFKMKWHQIGAGKVQFRLTVAMLKNAILCAAYVKNDPKKEKRNLAKFKVYIQLIQQGRYITRGVLK